MAEVAALVHAGKTAAAQAKLETCQLQHQRAASSLEGSLAQLRGDKFSDEQKKLDEVMNELADVAKDQDEIAAESNRIYESYAQKANEVAKEHRREAAKKVGALVEKHLSAGCYASIATHDEACVQRALATIDRLSLGPDRYEFQMLLGVDPVLRRSLLDAGHRLRVYVPFGGDWYAYSTRRLKENPSIARHVIRATLGLGPAA